MTRPLPPFIIALLLAGCGSAANLKPAAGDSLPVAPYGATATPTPKQLVTPSTQARPDRDDELLKESTPRAPDPFDLPPPN
ncbi:hypothetical protein EAH79_09495 [Sphingomonas koreensis]|nr:hypothetical protein EAH87_05510 [Sphingomonas koreensis]TPG41305.1 hypothetical protein EAH79_09495 [Sphingomonas koreensis]